MEYFARNSNELDFSQKIDLRINSELTQCFNYVVVLEKYFAN